MLVSNPCFRSTTPSPLALKSDRHDYLKTKRTFTISSFISLAVKVSHIDSNVIGFCNAALSMLIGNTGRYSIVTFLFRLPGQCDLRRLLNQKHMVCVFTSTRARKIMIIIINILITLVNVFCNHQLKYFRNHLLLHFYRHVSEKKKGNLVKVNLLAKHFKKVYKTVGYLLSFTVWCLVWQVAVLFSVVLFSEFMVILSGSFCVQLCTLTVQLVAIFGSSLHQFVTVYNSQIQINNLAN